ncbi:MAG: hypothetical protein O7F74_06610 [Bacteroidetes bacterium]|nr:hypothetical protein [Bacteroidota bacterium]
MRSRNFAEKVVSYLDEKEEPSLFKLTYLNLARIYAFQGDRNKALKYLVEYAKRGFNWGPLNVNRYYKKEKLRELSLNTIGIGLGI